MTKRLFDIILALILLTLFSPLIAVIAVLIKIKMGSPVIFKQKRPGLHGKPFYLFKFRTMTTQVDSHGQLLDDKKRLTGLGSCLRKYSLDELPQLLNVIYGDLSFVGPRPLLMSYLDRYTPEQTRRHNVKPGITGWAQVNGRNAITWEDRFNLDLWYVDNHNFWIDIKILFITFLKVIKAEGINQDSSVTMPEYQGSDPGDNGNN